MPIVVKFVVSDPVVSLFVISPRCEGVGFRGCFRGAGGAGGRLSNTQLLRDARIFGARIFGGKDFGL